MVGYDSQLETIKNNAMNHMAQDPHTYTTPHITKIKLHSKHELNPGEWMEEYHVWVNNQPAFLGPQNEHFKNAYPDYNNRLMKSNQGYFLYFSWTSNDPSLTDVENDDIAF